MWGDAARAGVNWVVVGSSVFQSNDPEQDTGTCSGKPKKSSNVKV